MSPAPATTLRVALGSRAYPICIGRGVLPELPRMLEAAGAKGKTGLVTDEHVAALHGGKVHEVLRAAGRDSVLHVLPAGEEHKRLARIEEICGAFLAGGLDRSSAIIALGGGVVGDIAGFAAACFMRGIPYVQVPTTIVAQVDSSVGGKTGVNHPLSKNAIGAFHQPAGVLIDMDFLLTLPERELRAGLAEVIKHGIIADAALFEYMEQHPEAILGKDLEALRYPILRSCEIKAAIVAEDETEQGLRANLNYGHTFGHGIESATEYRRFLHGEAIALGMCAAGVLAHQLGMVDAAFVARQRNCISAYGLPIRWPEIPVEAVLAAMRKDKKVRAGTMKFILAQGIGRVAQRTDIAENQARAALESLAGA